MLKAQCLNSRGRPAAPPVLLEEWRAWDYIRLQKRLFPVVLLMDGLGKTVAEAREDKIIYPLEWRRRELHCSQL
ncbi:hypothetical protein [Gorillibacterium sp. sgz5001074]|uniref:hypothetical protein n=1 Tax=Gorillibacterium sp. sgz5001074 TaxID=3446695 RepID=UPI003F682038